MKSADPVVPTTITQRSDRFHRWRGQKDTIAKWVIALGGFAVIGAVLLILFYLLFVVAPLFMPAQSSLEEIGQRAEWSGQPSEFLAIEEQQQVGLRIDQMGTAEFFEVDGLQVLESVKLSELNQNVVATAAGGGDSGLVAVAFSDGSVQMLQHHYSSDFSAGVAQRSMIPKLVFPYGDRTEPLVTEGAIRLIAVSDGDSEFVLAAATNDGRVVLEWGAKQENFLSGEVTLESEFKTLDVDFEISGIALSNDHRWLFLGDVAGAVHLVEIAGMKQQLAVQVSDSPISTMTMLLGGISLLVGDESGGITQLFAVRDANNEYKLAVVRRFESDLASISEIIPEQRRKGFIALDDQGGLAIFHSTAHRLVLEQSLPDGVPAAVALAPRASGLLIVNRDGKVDLLNIDNEHPEVSLSSLWSKVWYENYSEPEYIWQSSASSNEFEPKFSLTPLVFGTLKAAMYAMLFALPLALLGAAYTAYFMSPSLRRLVKPTIEIMAALPTVILGFLAGLWFAPFLEENLAGIFSLLIIVPLGLLIFAWFWSNGHGRVRSLVPAGWEPILLLPVLIILGWLSFEFAVPLQNIFFAGDLRVWLSQEAGISYDQRNALVVGCAMGFAVIPTIFSIAEDAIYGVPKSLSDGSLALGATSWQTLIRVILPTASPGMFSAIMIGLGRAVGETMIVLMATGNTPIMDWNLFEGMRTLAANIAVEMPESAMHSSHYRILFLAALVLFLFTFVVNTAAELIRQRLREKYSSL